MGRKEAIIFDPYRLFFLHQINGEFLTSDRNIYTYIYRADLEYILGNRCWCHLVSYIGGNILYKPFVVLPNRLEYEQSQLVY